MANRQRGQPVLTASASMLDGRLGVLQGAFPETFTEGKVDWEKLRAMLGNLVDDRPDRYTFTWAGRRDTIRLLQAPTALDDATAANLALQCRLRTI